jgi:hypothetical protein
MPSLWRDWLVPRPTPDGAEHRTSVTAAESAAIASGAGHNLP